jgi:hypothetical protein
MNNKVPKKQAMTDGTPKRATKEQTVEGQK